MMILMMVAFRYINSVKIMNKLCILIIYASLRPILNMWGYIEDWKRNVYWKLVESSLCLGRCITCSLLLLFKSPTQFFCYFIWSLSEVSLSDTLLKMFFNLSYCLVFFHHLLKVASTLLRVPSSKIVWHLLEKPQRFPLLLGLSHSLLHQ